MFELRVRSRDHANEAPQIEIPGPLPLIQGWLGDGRNIGLLPIGSAEMHEVRVGGLSKCRRKGKGKRKGKGMLTEKGMENVVEKRTERKVERKPHPNLDKSSILRRSWLWSRLRPSTRTTLTTATAALATGGQN